MLKKLQHFPEDQTLVAHTGVQFLDYGFRIEPNFSCSRTFVERLEQRADGQRYRVLRQIEARKEGSGFVDHETREPIAETSTYSVQFQRALEAYDGVWLPAPFLKHKGFDEKNRETFERGPTNWARMRVVEVGGADEASSPWTHRLTLAFDTRPVEPSKGQPYACPLADDVRNETRFIFAPDLRNNSWFLYEPWVTGWLQDELKRAVETRETRIPRRADEVPAECAFWAYYAVLLQGIATVVDGKTSSSPLSNLRFINTLGTTPKQPADVDLVLDIGNSRTCGVLIETGGPEALNLRSASVLELRDVSRPHLAYHEPFRSHVEFAPVEFGNSFYARGGGGRGMFKWPSLTRVGPEALRLNAQSSGAEGDTGLSGPKRYLWDERENPHPWLFNVSETRDRRQSAVYGDLLLLLTPSGESAGPGERGALDPKFSRASMFTFMVMELVLQAVIQINSADYRTTKQNPHVHRRLRRVLFTIPTATPLVELVCYQKRCKDAISLLWRSFEWGDGAPGTAPQPEANISYDEATCAQIVYLYNEIVEKLQSTSSDFFALVNRGPRKPPGSRLRVASIDIGGGTTDLMIVTYRVEHPSNALLPKQNFREGFRKAGDDILEAVVAQHVLKAVQAALAERGMKDPQAFIKEFIGNTGKDALQQQLRKLFVARVLVPIALHLLGQYETVGGLGDVRDRVTFGAILGSNLGALQRAVEFFESAARARGAGDFSFADVQLTVDFVALATTINAVLGRIIALMCEVIHRFDCDVLLLSGRPSRLPVIRDLVLQFLPTAPHRVIFMHEYRVGNWYPFAGHLGTIDDPKTTVVVGALICALAEDRDIRDFAVQRGGFTIESTAKYIGRLLGMDAIKAEDVIFAEEGGAFPTESKRLTVDGPIFIGFRQMPLVRWPGTPLFFLDIADVPGGPAANARTMPWTVTMRRNEPPEEDAAQGANVATEALKIDKIVDRNGDEIAPSRLQLRLQTLRNADGYWLDTGVVTVD